MAEETTGKNIRAVVTFKDDAATQQSQETASSFVTPQEKIATFEESTQAPSSGSSLTSLANEVAASSTVQDSVLADRGRSFDSSGASGTIIRETKRKRFRLLPAMAQASKEWALKQRETYDAYRHPYHPIAKADVRKDVIEKAVAKSAVAPREDFKTVAERLKDADRKPVATTITLKAKEEVPKPQWASLNETDKEIESQLPSVHEDNKAQEEISSPQSSFAPVSNTEVSNNTPVIDASEPEPVVIPTPPQAVRQEPEVIVPQEVEALSPVAQAQEVHSPALPPQSSVSHRSVHHTKHARISFNPRYLVVAFLMVAVISGVASSFLIFKQEDAPQEKAVVYKVPTGINAPQEGFTLAAAREDVLIDIVERLQTNSAVVQLYATFPLQDGTSMPATSEQILSVLGFRTGASFNRNVSEITFGGLGQEPFILMRTQNFDTAFAGMLAWEKTMSVDLSPLFGTPVVMTFDPAARTDTQVREAFFKDTIASNKNVRLLLDEEGNDRIVYTFINQNTLLITKTRTTLDALVPLIK